MIGTVVGFVTRALANIVMTFVLAAVAIGAISWVAKNPTKAGNSVETVWDSITHTVGGLLAAGSEAVD